MEREFIASVIREMGELLSERVRAELTRILEVELGKWELTLRKDADERVAMENAQVVEGFLAAKKVEGCSESTLMYYRMMVEKLLCGLGKPIRDIGTNEIRAYLSEYQQNRAVSKVTIDNMRRIFSTFFAWLEDEDLIGKSPVRRIHKVRTEMLVKEVLSDENMEVLRDGCKELRDLAMVDLLVSTGIRVGELVKMNRGDIDFVERQCVVLGKGSKERQVYFNARAKIHLEQYLESRKDDNPALFVSLGRQCNRLSISGVETRLRRLGRKVGIGKLHPHKFRRTMATMAIDKGMPIEQVQKLLGHTRIDTTLHYALVSQSNVKQSHRKLLG